MRRDRLVAVDLARTVALCGMVVFHFTFDLELFGHLPQGTTVTGGWAVFSRVVAGSFLFLSGVSLILAHGEGLRLPALRARFLKIAAAAALVSAATWIAFPQAFIFFGILHGIAFGTLLGAIVIRLHGLLLLGLAVGVLLVDRSFAFEAMTPRWLAWIGLGDRQPWSMDFVPVFPWMAAVLAGMGVAKLASAAGVWDRLGPGSGLAQRLAWPGRHSLAIYLVHQPILIGLVWLGTQVLG